MKIGNVIVGQSGGPTSVINASLAGVYSAAKELGATHIYGMLNGIQGLLEEKYVDLVEVLPGQMEVELLKRTPSSFLGSCRFKLPDVKDNKQIYEDIFKILKKLNIEFFFYNGGNDSMDTVNKLHKYAQANKIDIKFMGIPKTIDNDLACTDHSPGFGSAAKFIAATMKEIIRDGLVYAHEQITIVEVMGRHAGWLAAASILAKGDDCEGPDMIMLPEVPFIMDKFLARVKKIRENKKSIVIVVSEGIHDETGRLICETAGGEKSVDAFGHKNLSGTAQTIADKLTEVFGCKTRAVEMSTMQRCAAHIASLTDVSEAFHAGSQAMLAASRGESGKVIVFVRSDNPYSITMESADLDKVANIEKKVPLNWITEDGTFVSEEIEKYMRPMIQGQLEPIIVNGLPRHIILKK